MSEVIEQIDLSSYSLEELNALVDKAKREIVQKEQNRIHEVRRQIQRMASDLNLSLDEIKRYRGRRKKIFKKQKGEVKFRNPADPAQTWTGRGKRPRWLHEALARGAKLDDFAVA